MAYNFPLTIDDFQKSFRIVEASITLGETLEHGRTFGGEPILASSAERLWRGSMTTKSLRHDNGADEAAAMLDYITAGHSFFVRQTTRLGTQADPTGATYTGLTQDIRGINGNRVDINVGGLPANAVLTRGDLISFQFGGEFFMRRIGNTVTATASGNAVGVTVTQPLDEDITVAGGNIPAQVIEPYLKAVYMPSSRTTQRLPATIASGISFEWVQTYR